MGITVPWKRIIRFEAVETGQEHFGEPLDESVDVGIAVREGRQIVAREISATSILDLAARVTDCQLTIKVILSPLRARQDTVGIYCYGLTYKSYVAEAKMDRPLQPASFIKPINALAGPWPSPVRVPRAGQGKDLDYEAELVVIIGKTARDVTPETALDYVLGYTAANDVSTRANQRGNNPHWNMGKGLDTFCPIGPAVVSQRHVQDPSALHISGRRNGVLKQESSLSDLIFGIPYLVARTSEGVTLEPGTVILTGTPAGVALNAAEGPGRYLEHDEEYSVTVSHGVGTLENRFIFEGAEQGSL